MSEKRQLEWFARARDLSRALVDTHDPAELIPRILDDAIKIAGAERGYLVRLFREDGGGTRLDVEVARGFGGADLDKESGAVSRTVVEEVLRRGEGVVTTHDRDQDLLQATTVEERRVLSILCVPMRLRGETVGAIYLDNRFQSEAFQAGDSEALCLFADQAALALASAESNAERARTSEQLDLARKELLARDVVSARRQRLKHIQSATRAKGVGGLGGLRGDSEPMLRLYAQIERAARTRDPLVILGETGSGKSSVAQELHRLASPNDPLERWVGAQLRPAMLAALDTPCTCVLEELGDTPADAQVALLARLSSPEPLAARLIVTSKTPLSELAEAERLREDLAYRLDVLRLEVPPLRDRAEDVPALMDHFSEAAGRRLELTPASLQALADFAWPGNLHELDALVRRLLALDKKVTRADLPPSVVKSAASPSDPSTLAALERKAVVEALEVCGNNKAQAARRLGIQRSSLYRLLDRYGLR